MPLMTVLETSRSSIMDRGPFPRRRRDSASRTGLRTVQTLSGDDLSAFGGRVDAIRLIELGDACHAFSRNGTSATP